MHPSMFRDFIRSSSGIIVNKIMLSAFGIEMSVFLADLADRDLYFSKTNPFYDGSFYSTKELRCVELGETDRTLKRLMSKAVESGLVEVVMKGQPAKQWITLKYDEIERIMLNFFSMTQTCQSSKNEIVLASKDDSRQSIYSNHTKENISLCKVPLHSEKKTFEPRFIPSSEKLARIITTKKNIKITPSKINNWSLHLHKLHKIDGVSIRDIDKALDWLSENWMDKYCPHIESGQTFREKYLKLTNQMNKVNKTVKQSEPVKEKKPRLINDPNRFIEGVTKYVKFED